MTSAEEQKGDVGRLAAIAGLHQQRARLLLADPFAQVELVDDGLHVLLRRAAQRDFLAARQPLALALTNLLALDRDRLHALAERVGREQRHREREHGRNRADGREQHRQKLGVAELFDQKVEHGTVVRSRS